MNRTIPTSGRAWIGTAIGLAVAAVASASIAVRHVWISAQYGPICGMEAGHCGACYAAPPLAFAAMAVLCFAVRSPAVATEAQRCR